MKILLIIVILLLIGGFLIIANGDIRLNSWNNMVYFSNLYFNWLSNSYFEGVKFTGKVIGFFTS